MPDVQSIFADFQKIQHVKKLTANQRKIISLLSCNLQQSDVADRLHVSRPYVNQVIKRLEAMNLIKKVQTQERKPGVRAYTYFYEVCPEAKVRDFDFTPYRVHYIRRKFKILHQSEPITIDERTSFSKKWKMRGAEWYKFWYRGKSGYPSVTLDITPKTIVAYVDKGQTIAAASMKQAEEIGWYALYQARDKFILEQDRFGIHIEIERAGSQIGKCHAGLVMHDGGPFPKQEPAIPGLWIDKSVEKELGPGFFELEGHTDHPILTEAEEALTAARDIKRDLPGMIKTAMPEAMEEINRKLDPMGEQLLRVQAMIQGGITISQQYENMVNFMTKALDEMAATRKEMEDLKRSFGLIP